LVGEPTLSLTLSPPHHVGRAERHCGTPPDPLEVPILVKVAAIRRYNRPLRTRNANARWEDQSCVSLRMRRRFVLSSSGRDRDPHR
jgi:hypothetical protein